MKISCQSCQAKYTIADEKVLGKIVKIRCKKCGATIVINGNETGAQTTTSTSGAEAQAFDYSSAGGEQWTVNVADGDQRTMTQEEIISAYRSGVVNDDTYCWKDGMADWLPIREVQELYSVAGSVGGGSPDMTQQEPPGPAYQPPPPALEQASAPGYGYGGAAAASGNGNGATNGLFGSAPPPAAARRQGGRGGGGADLFGGAAQAGGEDDVMTSAPVGMPQASSDPGKLTGQRNENSVLFSLNALTQNAPKDDAPLAPGGTEGSGLIDIRALSATMGNNDSKSKSSHVDDIMNLGGGGAFSAALTAPVLAPPTMDGGLGLGGGEGRKDNTKMLLIAIIGAGALIALAIVLVVVMKRPADGPTATPTGSAASTETAAAPTMTAPAPTATVAAAGDNATPPGSPANAGGGNDNAPGAAGGGGGGDTHRHHAGGGGGGGTGGGGGGGGASPKVADNSPPPFVPPAPVAPAGGGNSLNDLIKKSAGGGNDTAAPAAAQGSTAPFDRGAAAAALGSVNVAGCKKGDGPTGSGHVKVTFGPNGTVQSAVVDQPPFAGTAVGGCVAGKFRSAHIPAFGGAAISVGKSFVIE